MKVCKRHIKALRRGMTYEIVPEEECKICQLLDLYGD